MNGKLLWRTCLSIFAIIFSAALLRNCREIKQDHEMQLRDHDTIERLELENGDKE